MVARTYHATRWARLRPVVAGGTAPRFSTPLSLGSNLAGWWKKGVGRFESADESDPAAANGNAIQRWSDQSGVGNHLLQATASRRPARYDDYVSCFWKTDGADLLAFMGLTLVASIERANFSGGIVVDAPCALSAPLIVFGTGSDLAIQSGGSSNGQARHVYIFNGASFVSTGLISSGRRMTIVWSSTASAFKIWVNGTLASMTALAANTLTVMRIGSYAGGAEKPCRVVEAWVGSRAMTDAEAAGANTYARTVAGALGASGKVITIGDSMSVGCGSDLLLPWMYRVTNRETSHEWRCFNEDGGLAQLPPVTAANVASMVTTGDVVVWWLGTNDIIAGTQTGAQAFTLCDNYRQTIQATGAKFIAATMPHFATNDAERINFNNALVAAVADFDAVVQLHAAAELDDATDTTYYTDDGVHLKDAGHAAAAALFQTAMASV